MASKLTGKNPNKTKPSFSDSFSEMFGNGKINSKYLSKSTPTIVKSKKKKQKTLFDIYRKQASIQLNYPTVSMCSDGDVCNYLKSIKL